MQLPYYFCVKIQKQRLVSWLVKLGFIGGIVGILAVIGYLLDAKELCSCQTTAIAVHTALGFILVSLGILFLHPQLGLMRTFTSETKTGQILRRFVPLALCLPLIIGWFRLRGQH